MKTITCDRCGKTFEKNKPIEKYSYTITRQCPQEVKIDLCDECRKDFLKWLNKPKESDPYSRF